MSTDKLTPKEAALLVLLMAEARDLTNTELRETYQVTLDGENRRTLNQLGYVETDTTKRPFVHRLTDAGWARCYETLDLESPRARAQGAALSALLAAVHRHLDRSGLGLAEFALGDPADPVLDPVPAAGPGTLPPSLGARIRTAYGDLAATPGAWVGLVDLRAALDDVGRDELDDALRSLEREDDVSIVPESNQKTLSEADRSAALWIGGQHRHAISMTRS